MKFSYPLNIILFLILSLTCSYLLAQEASDIHKDNEIEHITVTGEDQLSVLRYAMYRAEEEFFDSFNDLTTNKDFKITCNIEKKHAFTRLKQRKCKSAYESDVAFEVTQRAIRSGGVENSPMKGEIYVAQKQIRIKQLKEMEKLLLESPELQAKLVKLNQAKAKFEHAKQTDKVK